MWLFTDNSDILRSEVTHQTWQEGNHTAASTLVNLPGHSSTGTLRTWAGSCRGARPHQALPSYDFWVDYRQHTVPHKQNKECLIVLWWKRFGILQHEPCPTARICLNVLVQAELQKPIEGYQREPISKRNSETANQWSVPHVPCLARPTEQEPAPGPINSKPNHKTRT